VRLDDFDDRAVAAAVRAMRSEFYTNDVAKHDAMLVRHRGVNDDHSYKQMLGKYLSRYRDDLHLTLMPDSKQGHGRRWVKG